MMDKTQMTLALVAVLLILYVVVNYGTLTADAGAGYGALTDGSIVSWAQENPLMALGAAAVLGAGGYYMYYGKLPMMSGASAAPVYGPAPAPAYNGMGEAAGVTFM